MAPRVHTLQVLFGVGMFLFCAYLNCLETLDEVVDVGGTVLFVIHMSGRWWNSGCTLRPFIIVGYEGARGADATR